MVIAVAPTLVHSLATSGCNGGHFVALTLFKGVSPLQRANSQRVSFGRFVCFANVSTA